MDRVIGIHRVHIKVAWKFQSKSHGYKRPHADFLRILYREKVDSDSLSSINITAGILVYMFVIVKYSLYSSFPNKKKGPLRVFRSIEQFTYLFEGTEKRSLHYNCKQLQKQLQQQILFLKCLLAIPFQ